MNGAQLTPVQHGPPYGSTAAVVGGVPTVMTDVPIAAVLLSLFVASAAAHMTILQLNKRRGIKFLFSGMMFVLSVLRTVALSIRIVWASYPHVANIAIASGILTQCGSVLVLVINLILTQRIVRGYHPNFGWHPVINVVFPFLIACVVASLIMIIAVTVQSVLVLDPGIRHSDRIVQLFGGTYMAVLAFLPIPIVIASYLLPRAQRVEKFGAGRWRTKVRLLLFTASVATLGASLRVYTNYAVRPATDPAWYHSRAFYYCFNFVTDLIISATYLFSRFDRRFIVPNGAKGPGDYSKGVRPRPRSIMSSNGDEEGNETDPEKLANLRGTSNEGGNEKEPLPLCDEKGVDKGKGKEIDIHSDEKRPAMVNNNSQTYGPGGDWNGVPWPFRTSWTTPRTFGPAHQSNASDSTDLGSPGNSSPVDSAHPTAAAEETASQWGAETNSTYIQEPEPVHFRAPRGYNAHQLQHSQSYVFGQALTSNEEIHMSASGLPEDAAVWPFTSETHRDPVTSGPSRSNSAATYTYASSSRMANRGRIISRSRSCNIAGDKTAETAEGGWI
ncbi:hypothetical protein GQX73_g7200 [Xylaria multiplex]|uniref:Uncharacterized protein n=1 Tax=Xylaria multiplex TaxID=323545 RepID=A0A7C8IL58_9PEZI|nr:hypothetical protein GQX73_g7200 [Xylaria multiplex]